MTRFLHTGDWQLGMTRHFLNVEAQARFTQARFDALRTLGRVAGKQRCEFVIACGDVFEDNQVDRKTVARACEALASIPVPTYLLPGNHDPLNAASVFRSSVFLNRKPEHVHVLEDTTPIDVAPGVELIAAPWTSKRPLKDLVAAALAPLPMPEGLRIVAAHGALDAGPSPDMDNPAAISLGGVEAALREGRLHYLALGDRHSLTSVGSTGRIRYAGAPEPTDYDEIDPGHVLVVELTPNSATAEALRVATWRFVREQFDLATDADLDLLETHLREMPEKERSIVKLSFVGTLSLRQNQRLDTVIADASDKFAAVEVWNRETDLHVLTGDADFADLDLAGFAQVALLRLREQSVAAGPAGTMARDALGLLLRLAAKRA